MCSQLSVVYCWNMEKASLDHGILLLFIRHPVVSMLQDRLLYFTVCVLVLAHVSSAHLVKTSNISVGVFH